MGYVASKAGVLQLMKTLATVLAPTGIRFVCLGRLIKFCSPLLIVEMKSELYCSWQ